MNVRQQTARRSVAVAAVLGGFALFAAAPASAATNQVAGVQSPVVPTPACGDPSASFTMTGSLVGCWYEDGGTVTKDQFTSSGIELFHLSGTEHFTGCLDVDGDGLCTGDPAGTLYFTFSFTSQYDALTGAEIRGRCHHPIVGGSGDFAGATGVINFKDDISNNTSPYMGQVSF